MSRKGKANGAFIQHRECGTLVELNPSTNRAVGKMKATITQRFRGPVSLPSSEAKGTKGTDNGHAHEEEIEYDVDCDCRFLFFCVKEGSDCGTERGVWKIKYAKLIYEKDKVVPLEQDKWPKFAREEMESLPEGYKYLGAAQRRLGYEIDAKLVTVKDLGTWERMYAAVEGWLAGEEGDLFW